MTTTAEMSQKKKIGIFGASVLVAGNIMGSGLALLPSSLGSVGSISLFSWIITILGSLALAYVFSRLGSIDPQEGGPVAYATQVSPILGYQTGILYFHANWIGNAAIGLTAVSYLSTFWPILSHKIFGGLATIALIWFLTILNLLGPKIISFFSGVGLFLILIPIGALAIFGWKEFDPKLFHANWNVSHTSNGHAIVSGVLICVWAFIGIESASVNTSLVENPKRTIPIATIVGTLLASLVYILSCTVISGLFTSHELANSGAPFALADGKLFGSWSVPFVSLFTAIACITSLGSWMMLVAQAGVRASKNECLPKIFQKTNPKGVPVLGLILCSSFMTIMLILLMFFSGTGNIQYLFNYVTSIAVLLTILPYFYYAINLIHVEI